MGYKKNGYIAIGEIMKVVTNNNIFHFVQLRRLVKSCVSASNRYWNLHCHLAYGHSFRRAGFESIFISQERRCVAEILGIREIISDSNNIVALSNDPCRVWLKTGSIEIEIFCCGGGGGVDVFFFFFFFKTVFEIYVRFRKFQLFFLTPCPITPKPVSNR